MPRNASVCGDFAVTGSYSGDFPVTFMVNMQGPSLVQRCNNANIIALQVQ